MLSKFLLYLHLFYYANYILSLPLLRQHNNNYFSLNQEICSKLSSLGDSPPPSISTSYWRKYENQSKENQSQLKRKQVIHEVQLFPARNTADKGIHRIQGKFNGYMNRYKCLDKVFQQIFLQYLLQNTIQYALRETSC